MNEYMLLALQHGDYDVRFSRRMDNWRVVVVKDRAVVYEAHGVSKMAVLRKAYYAIVKPEPDHVPIADPAIRRRVELACKQAHEIVSSWKADGHE